MKKGIIKEHIIRVTTTEAGHDRLKHLIMILMESEIHRPEYWDKEYYEKTLVKGNPYNAGKLRGDRTIGLRLRGGVK